MKRVQLWAILATVFCCICFWTIFHKTLPVVNAQETQPAPRVINVTGDADIKVAPDQVVLTLGAETEDLDLSRAKTQNDARVKRILDRASQFNINPKDIQTSQISIEPKYTYNGSKKTFEGYVVRKTVVATLRDVSKFEAVLTNFLKDGANYVNGISFQSSTLRKHRDDARALAIKAAREKAVALAGELGQHIGKPMTITDNSGQWYSGYNYWGNSSYGGMSQNAVRNDGGNSDTSGAFAPGEITINASVSVSFQLLD